MDNTIKKLNNLIKIRKKSLPKDSYTAELFQAGENRIIKKLGEEFTELIMAASKDDKQNFIYESADVIYHYLVLLNYMDIDLEEIREELERRNLSLIAV